MRRMRILIGAATLAVTLMVAATAFAHQVTSIVPDCHSVTVGWKYFDTASQKNPISVGIDVTNRDAKGQMIGPAQHVTLSVMASAGSIRLPLEAPTGTADRSSTAKWFADNENETITYDGKVYGCGDTTPPSTTTTPTQTTPTVTVISTVTQTTPAPPAVTTQAPPPPAVTVATTITQPAPPAGQIGTALKIVPLRVAHLYGKKEHEGDLVPGQNVKYKLSFCNGGNATAHGVVGWDIPSNGLTFVSSNGGTFSGGKFRWNIGMLRPNVCVTRGIIMKVNQAVGGKTVCNSGAITAKDTGDSKPFGDCELAKKSKPVHKRPGVTG